MSIHVDYCDYDAEEYVIYTITLKGDDYELTISDPSSISDNDIDSLINNQQGCVYGGGNSSWKLYMKDDYYVVEFSISGVGGDATFKHTIFDTDMINELLTLIKEINHLSSNNIKYESLSDNITVEVS